MHKLWKFDKIDAPDGESERSEPEPEDDPDNVPF
jgi:hypothetical protein